MKKIACDKSLGTDLLKYRLKQRRTRTEIAAKIGVSEMSIYRWESGKHLPKSQYIIRQIKKLTESGA